MPERLPERYPFGAFVEINLADYGWLPGHVVQHAQPAVWVKTEDGQMWFVTNGRKIRQSQPAKEEDVYDID
jgi:hypothetical protein